MKFKIFLGFLMVLLLVATVTANEASCQLNATLINQDPFPALPGEDVDLVFQLSGVDNSKCEGANFELVMEHPFSLTGGETNLKSLPGSTWIKDNKKVWMIPYKLNIDEDVTEGWNEIEARYYKGKVDTNSYISENFEVKIEDVTVDYEISVTDYNPTNKEITFEILNIGEHDVEALTAEVPNQEVVSIIGSSRQVIGSLDSNEETTFTMKADTEGEIGLKILYTDQIGKRRTLDKTVSFNPDNFKIQQKEGYSLSFYLLIILIAAIIIYWFWKRYRKKS